MSAGTRLSDRDALIWRMEDDPVLRSAVLVVGLLDRPPPWHRARSDVAAAVDAVPHLRERVAPGGPGGRPRWVPDEDFDLDRHLRRVRTPTAGGVDAVLALAEPDATGAFDPVHPLWQLTLVEGIGADRAAFVLRFHHAITDGVGAVALATRLLSPTGPGDPDPAPGRSREGTDRPRGGIPAPRPAVRHGAVGLPDPLGLARSGVATARSAGRLLAPAGAPLSPVLLGRGLGRSLHTLDVPLADLERAARCVGGTINAVFLAAVGGALHSYHRDHGHDVGALRITMPVSVREGGDDEGGNRFVPVRFVLPVDDPDPAHRAAIAGAAVRRWRSEPALRSTAAIAAVLDRLPTPVVRRVFGGMLRNVDADVVDVPGLRTRHHLAGAAVERLWAFAPPTGAALSVTLLSHETRACIALACDRAAVDDPGRLAAALERSVDEVRALADGPVLAGARP